MKGRGEKREEERKGKSLRTLCKVARVNQKGIIIIISNFRDGLSDGPRGTEAERAQAGSGYVCAELGSEDHRKESAANRTCEDWE